MTVVNVTFLHEYLTNDFFYRFDFHFMFYDLFLTFLFLFFFNFISLFYFLRCSYGFRYGMDDGQMSGISSMNPGSYMDDLDLEAINNLGMSNLDSSNMEMNGMWNTNGN